MGKATNLKASEPSKRPIENIDERLGDRPAIPAGRHGELGNDPQDFLIGMGAQTPGKQFHFFGREAIEKEMRDEEVVIALFGLECAGIGELGFKAAAVEVRAPAKLGKHRAAGIDCKDSDLLVFLEQTRCESSIAIAEDESRTAIFQRCEKGASAAREERAEAEPFHPPVDVRETVEIGSRLFERYVCDRCASHPGCDPGAIRMAGTSRTASAKTRTASGASQRRERSSNRSSRALKAPEQRSADARRCVKKNARVIAKPVKQILAATAWICGPSIPDSQHSIAAQFNHASRAKKATHTKIGHAVDALENVQRRCEKAGAAQPAAKRAPTNISFDVIRRSHAGKRARECTPEK